MVNPQMHVKLVSGDAQLQAQIVGSDDSSAWSLGEDGDIVFFMRSSALSADAEVTGLIEGTSDHQGVAADSLIVSNITDDGDMMFLVSDGGNSKEFLYANGDTADLQLGHGMATATLKTASGLLTLDSGAAINIDPASGSAILLDGTISVDAGVVTGATSITSTAFVGTIDGVVGGNTPAAITGTTIEANTNFTVGDTVITNGTITDSTGLTIAAAVDLGANTLTSTGSMQIRTIDYSDGDLAMTIADGGGVSFASDVNINGNALNNVGVSGNNWTQHAFTLDGSESITAQTMTIGGTTGNKGINLYLKTAAAGNQQCNIYFYQGAGNGNADNMGYILGMDTNAGTFRLRSHDYDGNSGDSDVFRVYDGNADMRALDDWVDDYYDYICNSCYKHSDEMFTCCGEVKWHDDVLALREMGKDESVMQRMVNLGVMHRDEQDGWLGISLQRAQHFTWSAMYQLYGRIQTLERQLEVARNVN